MDDSSMKTTVLLLIAITAVACGGADHAATTTDPTGQIPTMNETAGAAPELPAPAPAAGAAFDPHDNSGFAGLKTESMSPLAAGAGSKAQTTSAAPPATATPARATPPASTQPASVQQTP